MCLPHCHGSSTARPAQDSGRRHLRGWSAVAAYSQTPAETPSGVGESPPLPGDIPLWIRRLVARRLRLVLNRPCGPLEKHIISNMDIPKRMQAMVLEAPHQRLQAAELPVPQPGADQVLIQV